MGKLETHHEGVETDLDEIHSYKFICKVYIDGEVGAECKIWRGGPFGTGILYAKGGNLDINNDNSSNDRLSVDDDGSKVFLNPLNMYGALEEQKFLSGTEGAVYFWRRLIANLER